MFNNDAERQLAAYRKVRAYISVCHLMDLVFGTISFFPSMSNVLSREIHSAYHISSPRFHSSPAEPGTTPYFQAGDRIAA